MVSLPTRFIDVDDTSLAYDRCGSGPTVVLLHAGLGDRRMWDDQVEPFAEHFDVIRLDARGFGESLRTEAPYRSAGDVLAVMDALEVERASLIGVSMGSETAIEVTISAPDRVSALVAVAPRTGVAPSSALLAGWDEVNRLLEAGSVDAANEFEMHMWFDGPGRTPNQVNQAARARVALMNGALFERSDDFESELEFEPPVHKHLNRIDAPTLVLWGDSDVPDVRKAGPIIALTVPGGRAVTMEDTGHLPQIEHPDVFNKIVIDFLLSTLSR